MIELALPGGRVAFSTRAGGVSSGPYASLNLGVKTGDARESVLENRLRLAAANRLDPERVAMGWQVHGADIQEWPSPRPMMTMNGERPAKVDGHATSLHGLGLLVLTADCLPVALIGSGRAAMLHCGWKPLAAGIVERALATFAQPPVAAIGPGIGACCYEVGPEVLERFAHLGPSVASGRMLDLPAVVRAQLEAGGVERIEHVDLCTSCNPDLFFSHRRDNGVTGRQGGMAWLER